MLLLACCLTLAAIPQRMQEFVDQHKTAGVVTLLAQNGHVLSFDAVGYQNLERKTPMRKDSLFHIMSLTKPITCAGIMILVDEGRLSLIDPVEKFLPDYRAIKLNPCGARVGYHCSPVAPARPINLADLMTHTSGLPASVESRPGNEPQTLAEHVALGAKTQLLFEPGTAWSYSNIGIDILGRIIEVVARQPFDRFLQDRLFAPLGMSDTTFFVSAAQRARLASLYTYDNDHLTPVPTDWDNPPANPIPFPDSGLISSALDLYRFNEMMRCGGTFEGHRVLSSAAVAVMTVNHTGDLPAGWSPGVGHGFGYEVVRDVSGLFRYNSLGTFLKGGAYRTNEWVDPAKQLVGILLMQRTNGGGDVSDELNAFNQISNAALTSSHQ